ncbi:MAG: exo-alpha-sialidase [Phaeodactylibacter sp.]|nr:exo-alpha-sialidase [Phaeodactylibacter sp.]MCB9300873.1 exo-alpha-sialidase [Lewinellaceae bacterium]
MKMPLPALPYRLLILFTLFFFLIGITACQRKTGDLSKVMQKNIPNVLIGESGLGFGPCEPSIAINPNNTDQVVAGAVLDRAYYSQDGGKTWKEKQLRSPYGVYGDPVILADYAGNFFYAHLADPSGSGRFSSSWLDRIVIQKSTDGGMAWSDGAFTGNRPPADQDKHWLAANPYNHHLYVTWTEFDKYGSRKAEDHSRILFSKSTDSGKSWSDAISINQLEGDCLDDDNTTEGAVPAVGPNGELYVSWAYAEKIYFDRSIDGGATWLNEDIIAADQPGGWAFDIPGISRCNGMPFTEADRSNGPHRGSVYINWSDQRNGEGDTDIWLAYSRDGGQSWSEPIRVNNDPAGRQQFLTAMAVDQSTGYIYIVFYDRRAYDDHRTDVYLAYSTDGGQTFNNQRISESPFTPTTEVFFGDYNDISAEDGHIRPIWTRLEQGELSVWTALVEVR